MPLNPNHPSLNPMLFGETSQKFSLISSYKQALILWEERKHLVNLWTPIVF